MVTASSWIMTPGNWPDNPPADKLRLFFDEAVGEMKIIDDGGNEYPFRVNPAVLPVDRFVQFGGGADITVSPGLLLVPGWFPSVRFQSQLDVGGYLYETDPGDSALLVLAADGPVELDFRVTVKNMDPLNPATQYRVQVLVNGLILIPSADVHVKAGGYLQSVSLVMPPFGVDSLAVGDALSLKITADTNGDGMYGDWFKAMFVAADSFFRIKKLNVTPA